MDAAPSKQRTNRRIEILIFDCILAAAAPILFACSSVVMRPILLVATNRSNPESTNRFRAWSETERAKAFEAAEQALARLAYYRREAGGYSFDPSRAEESMPHPYYSVAYIHDLYSKDERRRVGLVLELRFVNAGWSSRLDERSRRVMKELNGLLSEALADLDCIISVDSRTNEYEAYLQDSAESVSKKPC
jgi:hypothetical protein